MLLLRNLKAHCFQHRFGNWTLQHETPVYVTLPLSTKSKAVYAWHGTYCDVRKKGTVTRFVVWYMPEATTLGVGTLEYLLQYLEQPDKPDFHLPVEHRPSVVHTEPAKHVLAICNGMSNDVRSRLRALEASGALHYEHLTAAELAVDIMNNQLVPNYSWVTSTNAELWARRHGVQFPQGLARLIARHDPVARRMDLRLGDTVQVTALCGTGGVKCYLRHVVSHPEHPAH